MKLFSKLFFGIVLLFLFSSAANANFQGFLKDGNTWTSFDIPAATQPRGINDAGQVVLGGGPMSYLKDGNTWTSLDYPVGYGTNSLGINDAGQIVGFYETLPPTPFPVPEPAIMLLLGSDLIGLAGYGRKKYFKK